MTRITITTTVISGQSTLTSFPLFDALERTVCSAAGSRSIALEYLLRQFREYL
jgi:hypothetical protein